MFEKIKDFLYDISDIFVSLLIIAVIFLAVSWKISDTLSVDINAPVVTDLTQTDIISEDDSPLIVVTSVEPQTDENGVIIETQNPTVETTTESTTTTETSVPLVFNSFVVDEGSTGHSIGQKLQAEGYITDTNDFVKRLIELGYDNKLRSGTFKLSKSDNLDTLIKILAGQRR